MSAELADEDLVTTQPAPGASAPPHWFMRIVIVMFGVLSCSFVCTSIFVAAVQAEGNAMLDGDMGPGGVTKSGMEPLTAMRFGSGGEFLMMVIGGFIVAILPALALLVQSQVQRSVSAVWIGTVLLALVSFHNSTLGILVVLAGGLLLMILARLRFPMVKLRRADQPWGDLD